MVDKMKKKLFQENIMKEIEKLNSRNAARRCYKLTTWENILSEDFFIPTRLWRWNRQSVPNRWHIKFRRRGITQKKAYNIQNTA